MKNTANILYSLKCWIFFQAMVHTFVLALLYIDSGSWLLLIVWVWGMYLSILHFFSSLNIHWELIYVYRGASVGRNYGTSWKIVIGRHLLNGEGGKEEQTINVSYMTYKNYSNESVHLNDIALMKLNKAVTLNNYSNIICLPKTQDENPFPGTKCWIAGWGSMRKLCLYHI